MLIQTNLEKEGKYATKSRIVDLNHTTSTITFGLDSGGKPMACVPQPAVGYH